MKKHLVILFLGLYIYANLSAQPFEVKEAKTGKYSYQYVTNDPYKAHKYVLSKVWPEFEPVFSISLLVRLQV